MSLNREENYRYRKIAIAVLSKALDDICPKFDGELEETKKQLVKERIKYFKIQEKLLDKEWKEMEKEAFYEVKEFIKKRELIIKKIEKSRKTKRIETKIKTLNHKKIQRIKYLSAKYKENKSNLNKQLELFIDNPKKFLQTQKKISTLDLSYNNKLLKTEERFNKIIINVKNSNNSEKIDERIKHSKEVWVKKFNKLHRKFKEKETIYENKRYEQDQIRLSIQSFEEEIERIKHWCLQAGIELLECYQSVKERMGMVNRNSTKINLIIESIKKDGVEFVL